jgi:hypothetical protein
MIQQSTNAETAAANRAATPPVVAPPASQPATSNLQPGTTRAADSQPSVAPKPGGGGSTLNPQPLFPQSTGESDRAFEAFRAYLELGPKRRYAAVGRKVGASLRTVKRWASDFDWRGRIKNHSAQLAGQYTETASAVQRDEFSDAAARAKTFRDRQYALAEALLVAAERYLESMDVGDPDQMSFSDACKALEIASRFGGHVADDANDSTSGNGRALSDHLSTLLDQAYSETPPQNGAAAQPGPAAASQANP